MKSRTIIIDGCVAQLTQVSKKDFKLTYDGYQTFLRIDERNPVTRRKRITNLAHKAFREWLKVLASVSLSPKRVGIKSS